jgi:hypothetical protein
MDRNSTRYEGKMKLYDELIRVKELKSYSPVGIDCGNLYHT